jgi:hypothetical protein
MLVEDAEAARRIAEDDEVLTEQARVHRRAVALLDLFGEAHGHPMAPEDPSHRGVALDAAEQVVFLGGEHGVGFPLS